MHLALNFKLEASEAEAARQICQRQLDALQAIDKEEERRLQEQVAGLATQGNAQESDHELSTWKPLAQYYIEHYVRLQDQVAGLETELANFAASKTAFASMRSENDRLQHHISSLYTI